MIKKYLASIILYGFAIFVAFYAIWSLVRTGSLVAGAVAAGQITYAGSAYDIFSVYMVNGVQFIIFAVLLAAAGFILQKIQPVVSAYCPDDKKDVKKELAALREEIVALEEELEEVDDFFSRGEAKAAEEAEEAEEDKED